MEKPKENIYSLHRYTNEDGTPNYDRIFSVGESPLFVRRHLDSGLLKIIDNQPDEVRNDSHVKKHLAECESCRIRHNNPNSSMSSLPFGKRS